MKFRASVAAFVAGCLIIGCLFAFMHQRQRFIAAMNQNYLQQQGNNGNVSLFIFLNNILLTK